MGGGHNCKIGRCVCDLLLLVPHDLGGVTPCPKVFCELLAGIDGATYATHTHSPVVKAARSQASCSTENGAGVLMLNEQKPQGVSCKRSKQIA